MSGIWQLLLQFGSDHRDKQNNYKWFVIVNLPQRTVVKAANKARLQKTPISPRSFFFYFCFNRTCHIPIPQCHVLTDGWKQARPSQKARGALWLKLSVWVGGNEGVFLSERKSIQREGRNAGLGGFVVVVWRRGHYSRKRKSSNEGTNSYVATPLSASAVVLSAALAAAGHLMGAELWLSICSAAGPAWFLGSPYLGALQALQCDGFKEVGAWGVGVGVGPREQPSTGWLGTGGGVSRGEGQGLDKALWLQGKEEREATCVGGGCFFFRWGGGRVNEAKSQA